MVEGAVKQLGGLDVMVANAGVAGAHVADLTELPVEEWDRVLSINARGPFLCYKYAALQMIQQGRGGRIIGASSAAYSASKFAVRGLTQSAALEFGRYGITVNAYSPGLIDTPMITSNGAEMARLYTELSPLKRAVPEEIAGLVSYLASKESQFITGQSVSRVPLLQFAVCSPASVVADINQWRSLFRLMPPR
ncbi:hypothetical protein GGX14DRAFT_431901 [Mycena pura]|uniref:Uncharacterized protein n=1 Tax=Mycena pura TaxID=153505 RepID=A0AAD6VUR7_9AGAR|nr:hypothetical protein GGX14DRAFT_431901 [Mycena pura]